MGGGGQLDAGGFRYPSNRMERLCPFLEGAAQIAPPVVAVVQISVQYTGVF